MGGKESSISHPIICWELHKICRTLWYMGLENVARFKATVSLSGHLSPNPVIESSHFTPSRPRLTYPEKGGDEGIQTQTAELRTQRESKWALGVGGILSPVDPFGRKEPIWPHIDEHGVSGRTVPLPVAQLVMEFERMLEHSAQSRAGSREERIQESFPLPPPLSAVRENMEKK